MSALVFGLAIVAALVFGGHFDGVCRTIILEGKDKPWLMC